MSDDRRPRILDAAISLLEREGVAAFEQTRVADRDVDADARRATGLDPEREVGREGARVTYGTADVLAA